MDSEESPPIRRYVTRRNFVVAVSLVGVAILSFYGGLFYPLISSQLNPYGAPNGYSGLIVDYVTVNGPAINGGFYQSSCCPYSICSGVNGFGLGRLDALNQQNPPKITCNFRINANTSGFLLVIVFNTDWDITYRTAFTTSSTDNTVALVSMPDCGNSCYVSPVTAQWFRFGFAASADHDPAKYVTLSITVRGYCNC
ncbi:MAG: hypothetical protein ABSB29_04115 [Nitrososphaerales archaeon]